LKKHGVLRLSPVLKKLRKRVCSRSDAAVAGAAVVVAVRGQVKLLKIVGPGQKLLLIANARVLVGLVGMTRIAISLNHWAAILM